jgi:hypothetical protein
LTLSIVIDGYFSKGSGNEGNKNNPSKDCHKMVYSQPFFNLPVIPDGFFYAHQVFIVMSKKLIITESEKNSIRGMYGLIKEQGLTLPTTVTDSYTATNCDELHAFQGTGGKVIGNMNVTVGNKLQEIYNSGVNPKVTNVKVNVQGMTVTWTVTIDKSNDGNAWIGFTSRGAGCNQDVKNRAVSASVGNDIQTAKSKIESTYGEQGIEIEMVNDFIYDGGDNSFRQVFYRYTKPKNNPPVGSQKQMGKPTSIVGSDFNDLRTKLLNQTKGILIDENSVTIDIDNYTVTYKPGNKKIQTMSLIFDDRGQLENRLTNIRKQNPTMVEKDEWKGKVGNIEWIFVIIY